MQDALYLRDSGNMTVLLFALRMALNVGANTMTLAARNLGMTMIPER